jgi:hypothetical protein
MVETSSVTPRVGPRCWASDVVSPQPVRRFTHGHPTRAHRPRRRLSHPLRCQRPLCHQAGPIPHAVRERPGRHRNRRLLRHLVPIQPPTTPPARAAAPPLQRRRLLRTHPHDPSGGGGVSGGGGGNLRRPRPPARRPRPRRRPGLARAPAPDPPGRHHRLGRHASHHHPTDHPRLGKHHPRPLQAEGFNPGCRPPALNPKSKIQNPKCDCPGAVPCNPT